MLAARSLSGFNRFGFLNQDAEDYGVLAMAQKPTKYDWFCTSFACAGNKHKGVKVIESSTRNHIVCPCCCRKEIYSVRIEDPSV